MVDATVGPISEPIALGCVLFEGGVVKGSVLNYGAAQGKTKRESAEMMACRTSFERVPRMNALSCANRNASP